LVSLPPTGLKVGVPYRQENIASYGERPYDYDFAGGSPPGGTWIDPATGVVSGTPTTVGTYNYRIEVRDNSVPKALAQGAAISVTIEKGDQTISFDTTPPVD